MKVDLVIATYNRAETLRETLENVIEYGEGIDSIFVVDNASQDHTKTVIESFKDERLVAIYNASNLGAAAGKNVGLRASSADIIMVLDDDAVFFKENPAAEIVKIFSKEKQLGVVQFKIVNYQSKQVLRYEFPGDNPDKNQDKSFEVGYFIGAGHAIRKSMLERVGYYPDDFGLYAHEEVDLSYRAINAGFSMRYEPSIGVYHKKNPDGRISPRDVLYNMLLNRMIMSWKYLPFPYSFINNSLWIIKTFISSRSTLLISEVLKEFKQRKLKVPKSVLSPQALKYMKRNKGRLFR